MTADRLPGLRAGASDHLASGVGIFIRTARRLDRPMVTKGRLLAVFSADCLRVMTGGREGLPTVVTTAVHLELDLKGGSGVFVMADKRCVFS